MLRVMHGPNVNIDEHVCRDYATPIANNPKFIFYWVVVKTASYLVQSDSNDNLIMVRVQIIITTRKI